MPNVFNPGFTSFSANCCVKVYKMQCIPNLPLRDSLCLFIFFYCRIAGTCILLHPNSFHLFYICPDLLFLSVEFLSDLSPVGISLTSESCCNQDGQQHHHENLGFILVNPEDTVVNDLRGVICQQLETVPVNYRFLTKQG